VDTGEVVWDAPSVRAGPERVVHAADSARRALAALPDDQRATVLLVDGEGMDNVRAAEVLGVAPGTVASRLSRARATMRSVLDADEVDR
jgi:RNA polymerase sigma-70 factor (ECF subfamily)